MTAAADRQSGLTSTAYTRVRSSIPASPAQARATPHPRHSGEFTHPPGHQQEVGRADEQRVVRRPEDRVGDPRMGVEQERRHGEPDQERRRPQRVVDPQSPAPRIPDREAPKAARAANPTRVRLFPPMNPIGKPIRNLIGSRPTVNSGGGPGTSRPTGRSRRARPVGSPTSARAKGRTPRGARSRRAPGPRPSAGPADGGTPGSPGKRYRPPACRAILTLRNENNNVQARQVTRTSKAYIRTSLRSGSASG